jgi:glycosyltransferase involved in cell wall biosynthesis
VCRSFTEKSVGRDVGVCARARLYRAADGTQFLRGHALFPQTPEQADGVSRLNRNEPEEKDPVRLTLLSAGELFGGVERQLLDLCRYAEQRTRSSPHLVLFHDAELARQARANGIAPVILRARHRYDPAVVPQLVAHLRVCSCNVVHAHGYKAAVACALAGQRLRGRTAVVKTEHGCREPVGFDVAAWCRSQMNDRLGVWATNRIADTVTYVTRDIAARYQVAHRKLRRCVVQNGIEPLQRSAFARPSELDPDFVELGVVGRLAKVKGISIAIRALASDSLPAKFRLNIVGIGPEEHRLRREVQALGLGQRVRFLGFRDDVHDFMAHLAMLLIPSFYEGLPYTLLEAMSLGTPVVASSVGGLAEVLRQGQTGILVPPGDVSALRSAAIRLGADREYAHSIGRAAAAVQRRQYSLDAMGNGYWRVYGEAIARLAGVGRSGGVQ